MFDDLIGKTPCPNEEDKCFAEDATLANNPDAAPVQPTCPEWAEGFKCDTPQFLGKLNWILRAFTVGLKSIIAQLTIITTRIDAIEGTVRLADVFINGGNELIEVYSDGSTEVNDLSVYLDNVDTDTDTRYDNPVTTSGPGANQVTVTWDIINVLTGSVVGTDSTIITVGANTVDTNTFLSAINGDTNGGAVGFSPSRELSIARSDGTAWTLTAPPSTQLLALPILILNAATPRSAGTFDSGNVTINLNTLGGVTVPVGARGAIIRASSGVNGQNNQGGGGGASIFAYSHIEVASSSAQINGGNFFSSLAVRTQVTYADTNLIGADSDDTNEVVIPLAGTSIAYRAKNRFDNTFGVDLGICRIYLVGFIF